MINGLCDNKSIATAFCDTFSAVYFDSYANNTAFIDCLNKVHDAVQFRKVSLWSQF